MSSEQSTTTSAPIHIDVKDLTFGYVGREPVLRNLNMQLTNGARCLLIGANGAGLSYCLIYIFLYIGPYIFHI